MAVLGHFFFLLSSSVTTYAYLEYYVVTNIIGVISLDMNYSSFTQTYPGNLLFAINASGATRNPSWIIGILLILLVLIFILLILLFKCIRNIKNLNSDPNDQAQDKESQDDNIKEIDNFADNNDNIENPTEDAIRPPRIPSEPNEASLVDYVNKSIRINDDLEPFGFAYDSDNGDFYSLMYPWQRKFGYCRIYDETAPSLSMIFDSDPIYFDYNGKHWLIEFWKGQYGITSGGELGIYNTEIDGLNIPGVFQGRFYNAVDDKERLEMGFSLVKNNEILSSRRGLHWWLTSFTLGEFTYPQELVMYIEIQFPNSNMRDAFINGLLNAGYTGQDYTVINNLVYVIFDTPYTNQPYTRTDFVEDLMQENNRRNVELFNDATDSFTNIIDKLYQIKQDYPDYYNDVLAIGRPKQLYGIYNTIKKYLD